MQVDKTIFVKFYSNMFFKKYYQQKRRNFIKMTVFTGIFSGISGFLFSHFLNPKNGEENRKKIGKDTQKAVNYAEKTRNELIQKAKKIGENIIKSEKSIETKVTQAVKKDDESDKNSAEM